MSGFSTFPDPSARYTVADSFDMPSNPGEGTLVWQRDMGVLVAWTGSFWSEVGQQVEDQVLFSDYSISTAVWDGSTANHETLGGVPAIVTRIEARSLTGSIPMISMSTYETGFSDRVALILHQRWNAMTTITFDLWLPTDNLQVGTVYDSVFSAEPLLSGGEFSITVLGRWT
jgi:hypothetical protein